MFLLINKITNKIFFYSFNICFKILIFIVFSISTVPYASEVKIENLQSYKEEPYWQQIEKFLPSEFYISKDQLPNEEWWDWNGSKIHLDTYRNPNAKIKVILFHGVGTNGRQMSMILGKPLADRGYETIAIDMPGYGLTQVKKGGLIHYQDWVQIGNDLINIELEKDNRPVVLYGLSAGGMLTYHVAAKNRKVKAIVGMTFLDTSSQLVRDSVSRNIFMSRLGAPISHLFVKTPLASIRIPMSWASKMSTLVNNKDALKVFMKDKTSAGNSISLAFLESYLSYKPLVEPEEFDICPVLLTQPSEDRWTPIYLSTPFLNRIKRVPVQQFLLENSGHYPLENPGISEMVERIDYFYKNTIQKK